MKIIMSVLSMMLLSSCVNYSIFEPVEMTRNIPNPNINNLELITKVQSWLDRNPNLELSYNDNVINIKGCNVISTPNQSRNDSLTFTYTIQLESTQNNIQLTNNIMNFRTVCHANKLVYWVSDKDANSAYTFSNRKIDDLILALTM